MAKQDKKKKKLTPKEKVFIEEYIRCWNGAKAARLAGYSPKTARETAYELLTKPHIKEHMEERLKDIRMGTNEIYARLSEMARADIAEMIEAVDIPVLDRKGEHVGERPAIRLKPDALEKYGHLIKAVTPTINGDYRIELHSVQSALELMGKTWSIFVDRDEKGKPIQPVVNVYIPKNDRDD
jgi:phage terminase small subunit